MDKDEALEAIFADDPLGILTTKISSPVDSEDERLVKAFMEIVEYYRANNREPRANPADISEYQLHARLSELKRNSSKIDILQQYDEFDLLEYEIKEINSIDDIFDDDDLDILSDDDADDIYKIRNIPKERINKADVIGRSKPCLDFKAYEQQFIDIHNDLENKVRKLIPYKEKQLFKAGGYFVLQGVLLWLEKIEDFEKDKFSKMDGRTRIIFENGKESNIKLRTLGKNLLKYGGKAVTENLRKTDDDFKKIFENSNNTEEHNSELKINEDNQNSTGFIYVLKSESLNERISSISNLYKIGFSKNEPIQRIKNAEREPTYLMAKVSIVGIWECFDLDPHKFEKLIHTFFAKVCVDIDVYDESGNVHTPREWFQVPLEIIDEVIDRIIDGSIIDYSYDNDSEALLLKS